MAEDYPVYARLSAQKLSQLAGSFDDYDPTDNYDDEEVDFVMQNHWEDLGLPDPYEVDPNSLSDAEYEQWQIEHADDWRDRC